MKEGGESQHFLLGQVAKRKGRSRKTYKFANFTTNEGAGPISLSEKIVQGGNAHDELNLHPLGQQDDIDWGKSFHSK